MAWGVTHRIEYKDCRGVDSRIEFLKEDYAGVVIDCIPDETPFEIEMPDLDSIFSPVVGEGATIRIIATASGQYSDLYTLNPFERMVSAYKGSSIIPYWLGYLNTEIYGEDYSRNANQAITLYANNGFASLNRIKYKAIDDTHYNTIETLWVMLQRVLTRMGLPFQYLYFACDHACEGVTIAESETLFHNLKGDNKNFYDEENVPMTMREVLEKLLNPFPLQIRMHNGSLYIFDPTLLATGSFNAKRYDSSYTYVDTVSINRHFILNNSNNVDWASDDSYLDIVSGYNKQLVRFSPYPWEEAMETNDISNADNWVGSEVWTYDAETTNSIYRLSGITAIKGYTLLSSSSLGFGGHKETTAGDPEYYFYNLNSYLDGWLMVNSSPYRYMTGILGQSILFKFSAYFKTKVDETTGTSKPIALVKVPIRFRVGGQGPFINSQERLTYEWAEITGFATTELAKSDWNSALGDKWIDFEWILPWNFPCGIVEFGFDSPTAYNSANVNVHGFEFRVKDIEVRIVAATCGTRGDTRLKNEDPGFADIEIEGNLNEHFENEADVWETILGDGTNISDRGCLRRADLTYTSGWKKTGDSEYYDLSHILLRTIISEYHTPLNQLTGTIQAPALMSGIDSFSFFSSISDLHDMTEKILLCIGGTYDDFNQVINGKFLELRADDLTIEVE